MDKILKSLIVTHGFFDIYTTNNLLNQEKLIKYLLIIKLNLIFIYLFPLISFSLFVILSCYHFSLDFKYLKFYNYNIYGSLILISTLCDINKITYWIESIEKIIFIDNLSKILLGIFLMIFILNLLKNIDIQNFNKNIILYFITLILINTYLNTPLDLILYYLGVIHSPLAIIRKSDKYGYIILKYWLQLSFFLYMFIYFYEEIVIQKLNEQKYNFIYKIIISILNTHMYFTYIY